MLIKTIPAIVFLAVLSSAKAVPVDFRYGKLIYTQGQTKPQEVDLTGLCKVQIMILYFSL